MNAQCRKICFFLVAMMWTVLSGRYAHAELSAGIDVGYLYDDNVHKSAAMLQSDSATNVGAQAAIKWALSRLAFDTSYSGSFTEYRRFVEYNLEDHAVNSALQFDGSAWLWKTEMSYLGSHDERGAPGTKTNFSTTPVLYQKLGGNTLLSYQGPEGDGRTTLGINVDATRYAESSHLINNNNTYVGSLAYSNKLSGKTDYQAKVVIQDFELLSEKNGRADIVSNTVAGGLVWAATGKLLGRALVGVSWASLDNAEGGTAASEYTDISVTWNRKSYSSVSLDVKRSLGLAVDQVEVTSINNLFSLGAQHIFTDKFRVGGGVSININEFQNDESAIFYAASIESSYALFSRLQIAISMVASSGGNGLSKLDYISNLMRVSAAMSLL